MCVCVFCGAAGATERAGGQVSLSRIVRRAMKLSRRSHLIAVDLLFFKCYDYDGYYLLSYMFSIAVDA